jgi:hypothetical protein
MAPHFGLVASGNRILRPKENLGVMIIITRDLKGRLKLKWWS